MQLKDIFDMKILIEGERMYKETLEMYSSAQKLFNTEDIKKYPYNPMCLYPYLFKGDFTKLTSECINVVCSAFIFLLEYILHYDNSIDDQCEASPKEIFYKNYMLHLSTMNFTRLFKQDDIFWKYHEKYFCEYFQAVNLEWEKHRGKISGYPEEELIKISKGKAALAKVVIAALGCLEKNFEALERLEESQDYFSRGYQFYDDLKDINQDLEKKNYSWVLSEIFIKAGKTEMDEHEVRKYITLYRYDERLLEKSIEYFNKAIELAGNSNSWRRYVEITRDTSMELLNKIKFIKSGKKI